HSGNHLGNTDMEKEEIKFYGRSSDTTRASVFASMATFMVLFRLSWRIGIQIFSKEVEQHGTIDDCTAGVPHLRHRLHLPETFEDGYQIDIRHVSVHTAAASDIRYVLPQ